ncbi:hypothetical protein DB30_07306 [Enhygromyxa salina]|uniref:Uncharacterized protein n=1 Tax=Enhygromyxa salina TaxID=215803 RepID=A0A0C1Z8U1_9BACT|nr:hypothetical protein [Enhygromyxa salina]KIG14039.1 hypothetical protein DB30_07306 [Enhygromyxa salina]
MQRLGVYGFSVAVALAMVSPVLRRPPVDSFPLSTYPMFSTARPPISQIHTLLGVTASGEREVLSPTLISGDPWAILALETVLAAKRGGPKRRRELCEAVAARVAADDSRADALEQIVFVTETYDAPAYFFGETSPQSTKVHATCPVPPR